MRQARSIVLLGAVLLTALSACRKSHPDPRQVLTRGQAALRQVDRVEYRFDYTNTGDPTLDTMTGSATVYRLDLSGSGYLARVDATVQPGEGSSYRLAGLKQANLVELLDGKRRLLQVSSPFSGGGALVARFSPALMYPFFDPESLTDEIEAETVQWVGTEAIGGVTCDCVRVTYADDEEDSRWCFGQDDALPRSLEWLSPARSSSLRIHALSLPQTPDLTDFELPTGYSKEDVLAGPPRGTMVEPWSLPRADGTRVTLEQLRGQVVVLDFWATWCPPCRAELLALESLLEEYRDQPVTAFAVNAMEHLEPGEPLAFAADLGISFEVLLEGDEVHDRFAPGNLPALAVIDASGRVVGVTTGYLGEGTDRYIRELIDQALAAS